MMKDFFDLLVKDYGFPAIFASRIMIAVYTATMIALVVNTIITGFKYFKKKGINKLVSKDLHPDFTYAEIKKYTRYYIPQYFQNITPSEGEELGKIHAAAARSKLMPEFLKKGLLDHSPVKYFIILADTGMGKTAFLLNLYRKYKLRRNRFNEVKYNIFLFPLGSQTSLDRITKIPDKNNTILLLDAFDEDIKAIRDYKSRMVEILDVVKDFRKVVFTCRTQFFPHKDEEPTDTNDITFGENIQHKIQKLYLSAFDNRDITKYLFKKYGLNIFKFLRAYSLIKKSPSLMFRPMLLTYVDDLLAGQHVYRFSYEMYEVLIDKWINREAQKPAILNRHSNFNYSDALRQFSNSLAINLYRERDKRQGYYISIEDLRELSRKILDFEFLSIDDKTGRSLLNRNSNGQFKFSHKSILEYFLAAEVFDNPRFLKDFDFRGMDATYKFYTEMQANLLTKLGGKFFLGNSDRSQNLSSISSEKIKHITRILIKDAGNVNLKNFGSLRGLHEITFVDNSFLVMYVFYMYICFRKSLDMNLLAIQQGILKFPWEEYKDIIDEINIMIPSMNIDYAIVLIENCEMEKSLRASFNSYFNYLVYYARDNETSLQQLVNLQALVLSGQSERALLYNAFNKIKEIKKLTLQLPNTRFRY
ncbi:NACHT domain-containing protein [Mucilaginibacter calamicampi]|uniref:NACHT domain-containing protein n=1 Tax=Mucilaginibacter calamicampi TaxID=1302352 RepID=A0ABW2YXW4_9SPHI